MNHNALKWAAIGAGAWFLYRYLSKPSQNNNSTSSPSEPAVYEQPSIFDSEEEYKRKLNNPRKIK